MADTLEHLAQLADILAIRAGVNIHPQQADVDESFVGEPLELTDEELRDYRRVESPPVPK